MHVIRTETLSDEIISDVVSRDCVLWLTTRDFKDELEIQRLVRLIHGPWRAVFVENTSANFANMLTEQGLSSSSADASGAFVHVIASDPLTLVLPRRAKPVFFLNGREDRADAESNALSRRSADRRRLNMTARLRDLEARRILVVGEDPSPALDDLVELWDMESRSLLTIVTPESVSQEAAASQLESFTGLNVVHWLVKPISEFAEVFSERIDSLAITSGISVAVQLIGGDKVAVNLSRAELAEKPISDICDFVSIQDTLPVASQDLRDEEFRSFFTRGGFSWRPFAAGVPWMPGRTSEKALLKALNYRLSEPPGTVQVISIVSEAGAGGTTHARALAFAAAQAGFPALLVKQESSIPGTLELTDFLFRASLETAKCSIPDWDGETVEPVWLLVLDVQHASRAPDDLERLCAELTRSGRKVVVLKVTSPNDPIDLPQSIEHNELTFLQHEMEAEDVEKLGRHLNAYLRNYGTEKTSQEWMAFWAQHRPDIDTGIASFWIALEFWLAGFLDLGESIQSWILGQFRALSHQPETQLAVLEIATLSIERRATPERLLRPLQSPKLPWRIALDAARSSSPGLGLVSAEAFPYGRVWAIAHDVLARYLINGVWNDRLLCERLGLPFYEDSVDLRLAMIAQLSKRAALGEPFARQFAISLATSVLKLDEIYGNSEFFKHWRKVLVVLEAVPQVVRVGSRSFNHHLAISRRRITQGDLFQIEDSEKITLLHKAANELVFALDQIEPSQDDESNLNMLNTLARVYQDWAEIERNRGNDVEATRLLSKSDETTSRALKENPNSPYVLETAAKNLLRQGLASSDVSVQIESASKALTFVFQASRLDSAVNRRMKLGHLAALALKVLRDNDAITVIEKLCAQGSPYGYIAKAWYSLPVDLVGEAALVLDLIDRSSASGALVILEGAPERNWLLIRLMYDLLVIARPNDFRGQLSLLDELAATKGYQLSLQQVLERAVLLFNAGQNKQATEEFKWLRPRVKESQVVVFVPPRLRWLLTPDQSSRAICTAQVIDSAASARGMAKIRELGGSWAPFNPQEFGKSRMGLNEQFKCQITFAAMGPFLKPVDISAHR